MLKVKTYVGMSPGRGLGLFAAQQIAPGTKTWEYNSEFDESFSQEQVDLLPDFAKASFIKYAYFDSEINRFIMPVDDLRFINHSEADFNIKSSPRADIAMRLIAEYEELFCNYLNYEENYFERRNLDRSVWK